MCVSVCPLVLGAARGRGGHGMSRGVPLPAQTPGFLVDGGPTLRGCNRVPRDRVLLMSPTGVGWEGRRGGPHPTIPTPAPLLPAACHPPCISPSIPPLSITPPLVLPLSIPLLRPSQPSLTPPSIPPSISPSPPSIPFFPRFGELKGTQFSSVSPCPPQGVPSLRGHIWTGPNRCPSPPHLAPSCGLGPFPAAADVAASAAPCPSVPSATATPGLNFPWLLPIWG